MVETMPPLLGAGVRFRGRDDAAGRSSPRGGPRSACAITRAQVAGRGAGRPAAVLGGNGLVTVAEQDVPSGLAALLVGAVPLGS